MSHQKTIDIQSMNDLLASYIRDFELLVGNETMRPGSTYSIPSVDRVNAMFIKWNFKIRSEFGNGIEEWRAIDGSTRARDHVMALLAILELSYVRSKKILLEL